MYEQTPLNPSNILSLYIASFILHINIKSNKVNFVLNKKVSYKLNKLFLHKQLS